MSVAKRIIQIDVDKMCEGDSFYYDCLYDYLLERLGGSGANVVYVQVFSEDLSKIAEDKDRMADYLLFDPGHSLQANVINKDIFKTAVKMIREILPESRILVWTPSIYNAFLMPGNTIIEATQKGVQENNMWYRRASLFSELTHTRLADFFEALGQSSEELDGVMYQDDLMMSNWEDVSKQGIEQLVARYGLTDTDDASLSEFLNNDESTQNQDWRRYKTQLLDDLSREMFEAFRRGYQQAFPDRFAQREQQESTRLIVARDYYDAAVLYRDGATGEWNSQNLDTALDIYDHVVIMSYYHMSTGGEPNSDGAFAWLKNLVETAIAIANSNGRQRSDRLIFKLQSECWNYFPDNEGECGGYLVPAEILQRQAKALIEAGATGIGFYPAPVEVSHFDMSTL